MILFCVHSRTLVTWIKSLDYSVSRRLRHEKRENNDKYTSRSWKNGGKGRNANRRSKFVLDEVLKPRCGEAQTCENLGRPRDLTPTTICPHTHSTPPCPSKSTTQARPRMRIPIENNMHQLYLTHSPTLIDPRPTHAKARKHLETEDEGEYAIDDDDAEVVWSV